MSRSEELSLLEQYAAGAVKVAAVAELDAGDGNGVFKSSLAAMYLCGGFSSYRLLTVVTAVGSLVAALLAGSLFSRSRNKGQLSGMLVAALYYLAVFYNSLTVGADLIAGIAVEGTDGIYLTLYPPYIRLRR